MTWHPDIPEEYRNQIVTGDARELAERIPDESIDLIFTDPPYDKGSLPLYKLLSHIANRVLKPDGFLLTYSSDAWFRQVQAQLESTLDFYALLCVWEPGMNGRVFNKHLIRGWRPVFLMQPKGATALTPWIPDSLSSTFRDKSYHGWGQNELPAKIWIRYLCDADGIVFDPFTGGGTVPAVCKMLGRNYVAFEIDPDTAEKARERVQNTQPPLFVLEPEQMELTL
jgi:DNA modification methylase